MIRLKRIESVFKRETDEALRRILDIMDEANESVKAVYDSMGEKLANERKLVSGDKLELKSLLQDLKDTDKYMGIIEERYFVKSNYK